MSRRGRHAAQPPAPQHAHAHAHPHAHPHQHPHQQPARALAQKPRVAAAWSPYTLLTPHDGRAAGIIASVEDMDADFLRNRERIYADKMTLVERELDQAVAGTHPDLVFLADALAADRARQLGLAAALRDYQLERARLVYDAEVDAANDDFRTEKLALRNRFLENLDDMKKRAQDELDAFDAETSEQSAKPVIMRKVLRSKTQTTSDANGGGGGSTTGGADPTALTSGLNSANNVSKFEEKKRRRMNQDTSFGRPQLPVVLRDYEILDDIKAIRGSLNQSRRARN